jgi:ribosome-binding protein aMBF1 (putative translation factor)
MAKTHRGKGIRHLYIDPNGTVHDGEYNNGRGTCPVCERTGVKTLYTREIDGSDAKVCKRCNTAIGRGKLGFTAPGSDSADVSEPEDDSTAEEVAEE